MRSDGSTHAVVFETYVDRDSVFLGGLYHRPEDKYAPYVVSTGMNNAKGGEAKELVDLATLVAEHAPIQAMNAGHMSSNWYSMRLDSTGIDPTLPHFQGVPKPGKDYEGKPQMYELIIDKGERLVAKVSEDSKSWQEDATGERTFNEHEVAAWKKLGRIIPRYYGKAKYPTLYQREDIEPKSLNLAGPNF